MIRDREKKGLLALRKLTVSGSETNLIYTVSFFSFLISFVFSARNLLQNHWDDRLPTRPLRGFFPRRTDHGETNVSFLKAGMGPSFSDVQCTNMLEGWRLHVAWLKLSEQDHGSALGLASRGTVSVFRREFAGKRLLDNPIVRSLRLLLLKGGLPEERCASSFELLAKKVLNGEGIQTEKPGVAFRDILSLKSLAPWSVIDISRVKFPLVFRTGGQGEMLRQEGGNLDMEGSPLLCDNAGRAWTPLSLADEQEITSSSEDILLVCYAPLERAREVAAKTHLGNLVHMTKTFSFAMERSFSPERGDLNAVVL